MVNTTSEQQLRDIIGRIEAFRFCGPSDDPDEQTAVLYGFRHLVTAFRRAGRSISDLRLQKETQQLEDPETLYDAYDVHSSISAMLEDIKAYLDSSETSHPQVPMTGLRAFISYSTYDKIVAGRVKTVLEEHEIESFLAHEDIAVSQEWRQRIVDELQKCNIFVPLLSADFKKSEWAPQEIGIALSRSDMLFVPLSIDGTIPFGFISHVQGKRLPESGAAGEHLLSSILERFPHEIIPRLIRRLAGAQSYRGAESLMLPLVPVFQKFNEEEIDAFATSSIENSQIWDAGQCATEYLPMFLRTHRGTMRPEKLAALEYQVKNRQWYHLEKT